jgi:hypothetical protein
MSARREAGCARVQTTHDARDAAHGVRVVSIDWDSGYRASDLRVGDRIIGDQAGPYGDETAEARETVGDGGEEQRWNRLGLGAGDWATITVERTGELISVRGQLKEKWSRTTNEKGQRSFGVDGPAEGERDGFDYPWGPWHRQFEDLARIVLGGWDYHHGYDTLVLRGRIEPFRERVEFLERTYPCLFAQSVGRDFRAMLEAVAGEPRDMCSDRLEYRTLGETRVAQVSMAAEVARKAFWTQPGGEVLDPPFPVPHPFREDATNWIDKIVSLSPVGDADRLLETGRSWYLARRSGDGAYLVDRQSSAMQLLGAAIARYSQKVNPLSRQRQLEFIGVVERQPALVYDMLRRATIAGLRIAPLAAMVTDQSDRDSRFFVVLKPDGNGEALFAGEESLRSLNRPQLTADASPADVLRAYFECVKLGDFDASLEWLATWNVRSWQERDRTSYHIVDLARAPFVRQDARHMWERSRRSLLDDVYDIEVARVSASKAVFEAAGQPGGKATIGSQPRRVEEVQAVVNHVGLFDGVYRTFVSGGLHRQWTLQRLDEGPWRITSIQAI